MKHLLMRHMIQFQVMLLCSPSSEDERQGPLREKVSLSTLHWGWWQICDRLVVYSLVYSLALDPPGGHFKQVTSQQATVWDLGACGHMARGLGEQIGIVGVYCSWWPTIGGHEHIYWWLGGPQWVTRCKKKEEKKRGDSVTCESQCRIIVCPVWHDDILPPDPEGEGQGKKQEWGFTLPTTGPGRAHF